MGIGEGDRYSGSRNKCQWGKKLKFSMAKEKECKMMTDVDIEMCSRYHGSTDL